MLVSFQSFTPQNNADLFTIKWKAKNFGETETKSFLVGKLFEVVLIMSFLCLGLNVLSALFNALHLNLRDLFFEGSKDSSVLWYIVVWLIKSINLSLLVYQIMGIMLLYDNAWTIDV